MFGHARRSRERKLVGLQLSLSRVGDGKVVRLPQCIEDVLCTLEVNRDRPNPSGPELAPTKSRVFTLRSPVKLTRSTVWLSRTSGEDLLAARGAAMSAEEKSSHRATTRTCGPGLWRPRQACHLPQPSQPPASLPDCPDSDYRWRRSPQGDTVRQSIHTYIHTYIHTCMHACMHAYMHTCTHAHMHTCIHAYMHTCIHAYMHTYILTYLQTDIHT